MIRAYFFIFSLKHSQQSLIFCYLLLKCQQTVAMTCEATLQISHDIFQSLLFRIENIMVIQHSTICQRQLAATQRMMGKWNLFLARDG